MHAEALRQHEGDDEDLLTPVLKALALHAAIVGLLVLAGWWQPAPEKVSVAGPVVQAALVISEADVVQAQQAVEEAPKPAPPEPVEAAPPPQPEPAPQPQDAPDEIQPVPQELIPEPDTVDQEEVARLAAQAADREREEQEERRRQEQVDLTERERQAEAERRQRRREQVEAIQREREEARRITRMEEQRLQQLADAQAARRQPEPSPARTPAQSGNNGEDTDLLARYALAMHQLAETNWNRSLAPEATPCKVSFTQIPGGEVIDVRFLSCSFDGPARESVERALRRDPMPYAGFEPVFRREVELTFCYPEEACPR